MSTEVARILVVDDEFGIREGCRKILTAEGYNVESAEDGVAGLKLFEERQDFAAALVDLKMPRMDGIELIEKIRELDEDIALLVITAYATIDTAVEATKRGAYGYIPKPFTPDELLLPLKNGLERRALSIEAERLKEERERQLLVLAFERSKSNTIINCMTDAVLVVNRDRQIVLRNAAAARIMPACADLALPVPLERVEICVDLSGILSDILDACSGPVIASKEIALGKRTYMVNASPVIEPSGETLGAVAVLRDITALKKLETAKSMFVSMVAHEIKNPLAAIEGYLNVILGGFAGRKPEEGREIMQRALVRAKTLRTMISELMNLTAMETGRFTIKRAPLDVGELAVEAVKSCRDQAHEKEIELSFECEGEGDHALADREAMLSAFTNLIDNAVKYTPNNGHVGVRVKYDGMYVKVSVTDDGIGMTPDERDRAFEEFFRAKNEYTARVPGTGLGLSLAKRLVEMHEGRITLESSPGKGSTFTITLPVLEH